MMDFLYSIKEEYERESISIVAYNAPQIMLDALMKNYSLKEGFITDWRK